MISMISGFFWEQPGNTVPIPRVDHGLVNQTPGVWGFWPFDCGTLECSHMTLSRVKIHPICECMHAWCVHTVYPAMVLWSALMVVMRQLQSDWLCRHSCRCNGLTARVPRPSFRMLVYMLKYIQHCGKLGSGS